MESGLSCSLKQSHANDYLYSCYANTTKTALHKSHTRKIQQQLRVFFFLLQRCQSTFNQNLITYTLLYVSPPFVYTTV